MNDPLSGGEYGRRRRKQLITLHKFQNGLCCHCREPMILDFDHITGDKDPTWDHATIEHCVPLHHKGLNQFCNLLAAHYQCNNDRGDKWPTDELIDYHLEIHRLIEEAGEYPLTAQRVSALQFIRPAVAPDFIVAHRDEEAVSSPFAVLASRLSS